mmetsp:Transcript_61524/g.133663  ORF Transcript_61524/g.133663 Transcript_61524/m.133663 type:complete len:82 (+) Transcript_61524:17-262(+)
MYLDTLKLVAVFYVAVVLLAHLRTSCPTMHEQGELVGPSWFSVSQLPSQQLGMWLHQQLHGDACHKLYKLWMQVVQPQLAH